MRKRVAATAMLVIAGVCMIGYAAAVGRGQLGSVMAETFRPMTAVTRTSGYSKVHSDAPGYKVTLRSCDVRLHFIPVPDATCDPIDYLADGARVTMRCWEDTEPPLDDTGRSSRWFYVNEVDGGRSGWSGYLYSALIPVGQQIIVPRCSDPIRATYAFPKAPPSLTTPLQFRVVGTCTTAGGTLTSASANFPPATEYFVEATDPGGHQYPFDGLHPLETYDGKLAISGTANLDGSVNWTWPCAGDPPGTYTTKLIDSATERSTGQVSFTIDPAPSMPAPTAGPTPTPPATPSPTQGPRTPAQPTPPSTSTPSPASTPPPATTAPPPPEYDEQEGQLGANTFTDPYNASGMGQKIAAGAHVHVQCKVYAPAIPSANPDGYWYRVSDSPWNGRYYAVANTFMNGDPWNGPYTHNTDWSVPNC